MNLGLCCFYAQQYDMALACTDRALTMATDDNVADIWYNLGHIALSLGDLGLAYQSFKISVASDHHHAESYCILGVTSVDRRSVGGDDS